MQIKIQEEMSSKQKIPRIQIISLVDYNINDKSHVSMSSSHIKS